MYKRQPFLPHTPHNPPKELLDKYINLAPNESIAKYWAMCEWLDKTVGEMMNYLKEKSLDKNTPTNKLLEKSGNGNIKNPATRPIIIET